MTDALSLEQSKVQSDLASGQSSFSFESSSKFIHCLLVIRQIEKKMTINSYRSNYITTTNKISLYICSFDMLDQKTKKPKNQIQIKPNQTIFELKSKSNKKTIQQKWPLHRGIRRASGSPPPRSVVADKASNSVVSTSKQVWVALSIAHHQMQKYRSRKIKHICISTKSFQVTKPSIHPRYTTHIHYITFLYFIIVIEFIFLHYLVTNTVHLYIIF